MRKRENEDWTKARSTFKFSPPLDIRKQKRERMMRKLDWTSEWNSSQESRGMWWEIVKKWLKGIRSRWIEAGEKVRPNCQIIQASRLREQGKHKMMERKAIWLHFCDNVSHMMETFWDQLAFGIRTSSKLLWKKWELFVLWLSTYSVWCVRFWVLIMPSNKTSRRTT